MKSLFEKTQNGVYSRDSNGGITSYAEASDATSDTIDGDPIGVAASAAQVNVEPTAAEVAPRDEPSVEIKQEPAELTRMTNFDGVITDDYDRVTDSETLKAMINELSLSVDLSEGHLLALKKEVF